MAGFKWLCVPALALVRGTMESLQQIQNLELQLQVRRTCPCPASPLCHSPSAQGQGGVPISHPWHRKARTGDPPLTLHPRTAAKKPPSLLGGWLLPGEKPVRGQLLPQPGTVHHACVTPLAQGPHLLGCECWAHLPQAHP